MQCIFLILKTREAYVQDLSDKLKIDSSVQAAAFGNGCVYEIYSMMSLSVSRESKQGPSFGLEQMSQRNRSESKERENREIKKRKK